MGAEVVRVDRKGHPATIKAKYNLVHRGRRSICLDLAKRGAKSALLMD
jgi:crotonobetainyl-CoA:carnitine CoA-transferase CaiB-like acyl-CoA transferase